MNLENTSTRLKKIMNERHLRQVDLLEKVKPFCEKYNVKMNKSDISQYISGSVMPGQIKLMILSLALNVSPVWLMGFDIDDTSIHSELSSQDIDLLNSFNKLNDLGKSKVLDYSKDLSENIKYTYEEPQVCAAHDDNLTDDEKETMDSIINAFEKNLK